jgi:hypothetical protein
LTGLQVEKEGKERRDKEIEIVGGWNGFSHRWCFHPRIKGVIFVWGVNTTRD